MCCDDQQTVLETSVYTGSVATVNGLFSSYPLEHTYYVATPKLDLPATCFLAPDGNAVIIVRRENCSCILVFYYRCSVKALDSVAVSPESYSSLVDSITETISESRKSCFV